jgi:hypothetical protein
MAYFTTRGAVRRNDDLKYLKGPGMNKNTGGACGRGWVGVKGHCKRQAKNSGGVKSHPGNQASIRQSRMELVDRIRAHRGLRSLTSIAIEKEVQASNAKAVAAKASKAKTKAKKAAAKTKAKKAESNSTSDRLAELRGKFPGVAKGIAANLRNEGTYDTSRIVTRQAKHERFKRAPAWMRKQGAN